MRMVAEGKCPESVKQHGRQASATVSGIRRNGFLMGNRFVYSNMDGVLWLECGPGEFKAVKIWRK